MVCNIINYYNLHVCLYLEFSIFLKLYLKISIFPVTKSVRLLGLSPFTYSRTPLRRLF